MKIFIKGWHTKGLRCPDMDIELSSGNEGGGVSLIQMPNGTGKTTTLTLLKACLTGEATNWSQQEIAEFAKPNSGNEVGVFRLDLLYDMDPLTIELTLNFEGNSPTEYKTTAPKLGGVINGWDPPVDIRQFLQKKVVNLFIFDGEFADELMSQTENKADEAIDTLCQIDLLKAVSDFAELDWGIQTRSSPKTETGVTQQANRVSALKELIREEKKKKEQAVDRKASNSKKIEKLTGEINAFDSTHKHLMDKRQQVEQKLHSATESRDVASKELFDTLRNPILIHKDITKALHALKSNLDSAKLPSNTSRQFFTELAMEDTCICGRPLGDTEKDQLTQRAEMYLGTDITSVINALKEDIAQADDDIAVEFEKLKINFDETQQNLQKAITNRDKIEREFQSASPDERNDKYRDCEKLKDENKKLTKIVDKIEGPYEENGDSLASLEKRMQNAEDRLDAIADTVKLGKRKNLIKKICDRTQELARGAIKADLINACNKELERILIDSPLAMEAIDGAIKLKDQDKGSVGQQLAVGYAFLTSLLARSQHTFPLVVDSPANSIDLSVRAKIGEMIPKLCTQFIAFTTSSETEAFVPALANSLDRKSDREIDYITVFRKTESNASLAVFDKNVSTKQTSDGWLVKNKEYFMQFQTEEEDV